jgi:hypothetical protein
VRGNLVDGNSADYEVTIFTRNCRSPGVPFIKVPGVTARARCAAPCGFFFFLQPITTNEQSKQGAGEAPTPRHVITEESLGVNPHCSSLSRAFVMAV